MDGKSGTPGDNVNWNECTERAVEGLASGQEMSGVKDSCYLGDCLKVGCWGDEGGGVDEWRKMRGSKAN